MKDTNRKADEQLRHEISNILLFEISDPRLQFVTITGCKVSFDRAYAEVFYTTDRSNYNNCEQAFLKASGKIRKLLSSKLDWKKTPQLRFHLDEVIDNAENLEKLISS